MGSTQKVNPLLHPPPIKSSTQNKMLDSNESKASLYESVLIGAGLLAVSAASSKLMKDSLGITLSGKNAAKIIVGVAVSNYIVDFAKKKKYINVEMFNSP